MFRSETKLEDKMKVRRGSIMGKHIVFVMGKYTPETSANVNCVKNVIHELKQQNHKISVVCASNEKTGLDILDDVRVHRIKFINYASKLDSCNSALKKQLLVFGHFIKSVFLLPLYPNVTPSITNKVYKKLLHIQNNEGIDCVISVFQPYFPIKAALKFKNKFKTIPAIGYYLDVMKGANRPFGTTQQFFEMLCDKSQKRDFSKLDNIFLPECSKVYYDIDCFSAYHDKMQYLNFPTLLKENFTGENINRKTNLIYAGTTNKTYRNPIRAINLFIKLKEHYPDLVFNLYGNSDIKDELEKLATQSKGAFFYHGLVTKDVADLALQQADYCVNFGNCVYGMVPSKIFELIATGKSIIHFTSGVMDSSVEYLRKYPKAYIIDLQKTDDEIEADIKTAFEAECANIDYAIIENLFYSATPKAVVDKIMEIVLA